MKIDTNLPLPPVRIAGAVDTDAYANAFRRQRVKPTLLVRAFEGPTGLWLCEARNDEEGPRVNTADLGFPPFTSKNDALAFSGDVCAAWWRKHA